MDHNDVSLGFSALFVASVCIFIMLLAIHKVLVAILREIECLHQDYDTATEAHEQLHWKRQAKMDEDISRRMTTDQNAK